MPRNPQTDRHIYTAAIRHHLDAIYRDGRRPRVSTMDEQGYCALTFLDPRWTFDPARIFEQPEVEGRAWIEDDDTQETGYRVYVQMLEAHNGAVIPSGDPVPVSAPADGVPAVAWQ